MRTVPGVLRARVLLGGGHTLIGLALIAFMQVFAWVFVPMLDVPSLWEWNGEVVGTSGTVVSVRPINAKVNSRRVMAVDFHSDDGRYGTSYTTGLVPGAGRTVSLEQPAGHPEHVRIAGMTRSPMPVWVAALLLPFPVVGLIFVTLGVLLGRRRLALLESGRVAQGTFVGGVKTSMRVNHQRIYRLRYRFVTEEGREVVAVAGTSRGAPSEHTGGSVPLLYDESLRAEVPHGMPGRPTVVGDRIESNAGPLWFLLVPLALAAIGG